MMNTVCRRYAGKELLYAYFPVMHTRCDLLLCSADPQADLGTTAERIRDLLLGIERTASYFDPRSELFRLNERAADAPVEVSPMLLSMIRTCLAARERTLGLFDITVRSLPHDRHTAERIRIDGPTLRYEAPGMSIDLSGFAKGYALDRVRGLLDEEGVKDALVNLGNSSVYARGRGPSDNGWRIGYGGDFGQDTGQSLLLQDRFLTTSGNDSPERRHIVDPLTGQLREGRGAVGVVTDSGAAGEILSTSLFLATPSQRRVISERFGHNTYYEL